MTEGLEKAVEALNRFNELSDAPLAESALAARAVIEAAAPAIRKQERQRIREALEPVLFHFDAGRSRGVKREYDKALDREDRHAGHGEAEAYDRASSMLRRVLDTLEVSDA